MEHVKSAFITVISALLAFIEPIGVTLALIASASVLDIIIGYHAGKKVHAEKWSNRKARQAMVHVLVYLGIIVAVYVIGALQGDREEVLYVEKLVTYLFIYFYAKNALKNLRELYPGSRQIAALDDWVGLEFLNRFPGASKIVKSEQDEQKII